MIKPQNFEERLVWYSILGTYILYALGLVYIYNSAIAWVLLCYLSIKLWYQTAETPIEKKIKIPWIIWLWIICMLVMAIGIYIGLTNFNYDNKVILTKLILWFRSWALIALFPLAGCCLNIRPKLIYRANCLLCFQSLFFILISYTAYLLNIPNSTYDPPIKAIIKSGSSLYDFVFYFKDTGSGGGFRLTLFAPWSPALALLAVIYFFFALQEENKRWRWIGLISSILMAYLTASRTAIVCLPLVLILSSFLTNIYRISTQIVSSITCFVFGIFSTFILDTMRNLQETFTNARPDSSRVRKTLGRIGLERFKDAPIWGHGLQEPGFKGTENMLIGSHHTWIGLLFVNGLVGFLAFLIPMICSIIYLLIKGQHNSTAKVGLSFLLALIVFSFGENQETLAYLYWPALIIMGVAFKEKNQQAISEFEILPVNNLKIN